jgi:hypothetical protein
MEDKELIKKIVEEVKDEKLREELLALVVEKNKKKDDTKQEEEKPIDYVAKQAVLLGQTETTAKLSWWVGFIISTSMVIIGIVNYDTLGLLFIPWGLLGIYVLWKGREEYKKKFERRSKEDIE